MTVLAHTELKNLILGLQHVGFVVADLDAALQQWQQLYDVDSNTIRRVPATKAEQNSSPVLFAFFTVAGQEIELIQPKADPYLTLMLAMKSGQAGINHVAWRVSDLSAALQLLAHRGVYPGYVTPNGLVQFGQKKMAYLDPATTGGQLIELIEINEC